MLAPAGWRRRLRAGVLCEGEEHGTDGHPHFGAGPLLQDLRARLLGEGRAHRRGRHLPDDGVHPVRQSPGTQLRRGTRARRTWSAVPGGAGRDGTRRRCHDAGDGAVRQLPVRARLGTRAERVRGVHAGGGIRPHLPPGDGRHRHRGNRDHGPRDHGVPRGGAQRDPDGPQAGDRHRHRPVHRLHRADQRGRRRAPRRRRPDRLPEHGLSRP